ncbi:methyltransferase domain-containing protein [Glaciibacter flavus]|uniref:Methyltransferase domain-containing protein n=1 Tax=Orlajensenia flava TaxID=2565934 RepID=A0A4S4FXH2_9MICO|nr:class I SAM-dependent methyltransferase [Glaciibacter flavus]THG34376.1 methyltransferase domain-containing protein [Glaciibacter flavus]
MTSADTWQQGDPYERYIGRWSRRIAPLFLERIAAPEHARWVDVGCGTGALSEAILAGCAPAALIGVEPSSGFRAAAATRLGDPAQVVAGDASALPLPDDSADVVVSGLVLNFVPDPHAAVREMVRVATAGALIAGYVWDYGDGMEIIRRFWDVAVPLDPAATTVREATGFDLCTPDALRELFAAHLADVGVEAIDLIAEFEDFDDYWMPFLGGQGPAPAYVATLTNAARERLREELRRELAPSPDGPFTLRARAWSARGVVRAA